MLRIIPLKSEEFELKFITEDAKIYRSPVRCPKGAPPIPEGWKLRECGGAYPYYVTYDPSSVELIYLRAKEISYLPRLRAEAQFITDIPASVHGCWKIRKNQVVVLRRRLH